MPTVSVKGLQMYYEVRERATGSLSWRPHLFLLFRQRQRFLDAVFAFLGA